MIVRLSRRVLVTCLSSLSLCAVQVAGCDPGDGIKVVPRVVKIDKRLGSAGSALSAYSLTSSTHLADDGANAQTFTPTSIKMSLVEIDLVAGSLTDWNGQRSRIYDCPSQQAQDCLVELSDIDALEDSLRATPVVVQPGNYTKLSVGTCRPGQNTVVEVTGHVEIDGATYVTDTTAGLKAGQASEATPVRITYQGCATQYLLSQPMVIEEAPQGEEKAPPPAAAALGAQMSLNLAFDAKDFVLAGNASNKATKELVATQADNLTQQNFDNNGCVGAIDGLFVCVAKAILVATDDEAPSVTRFPLTLTAQEAFDLKPLVTQPGSTAYIGIVFDSKGTPLAGFQRRAVAYNAQFNRPAHWDSYFSFIDVNADKSLALRAGPTGECVIYPAFGTAAHSGTALGCDAQSPSLAYSVTVEP